MLRIFDKCISSKILDYIIIVSIFVIESQLLLFVENKLNRYQLAYFSLVTIVLIVIISFIVAKNSEK